MGMFGRLMSWVRRHPVMSVVFLAAIGLGGYQLTRPKKLTYEYVTEAVTQGEVVSKVTASGKLRALNTIKVGSEVSGQILRVNVDFNTPVRAGQVLAEIDPTRFRALVQQAQAQVSLAQAAHAQAEAAFARARTDISVQEREFGRRQELARRGFLSKAALDGTVSQLASARAAVRSAEAQIQSARAQMSQSSAQLTEAQLNLNRTVIISPTSGVVINKLVEPGTTVAASFQTPNLFEIAADTTRMQVEASVDEADIGQVKEGQAVNFTVDSYPETIFPAVVRQVRKGGNENQNVVSYLVILDVDNADGKLLPGMTANVDIITAVKKNTLRLPVQALRFRPRADDREPSNEKKDQPSDKNKGPVPVVYVPSTDSYKPKRRIVGLGIQGEDFVEVISGLKPGEKVVVRSRSLEKKEDAAAADEEEKNDDSPSSDE